MNPINSISSFSLASSRQGMNISYKDLSSRYLYGMLQLNALGIEREMPQEIARRKYENIPSILEEIRQEFASIDKSDATIQESNLPLSLFTYLYLYLQSTVSARVAENPESDLLEIWSQAEVALHHLSTPDGSLENAAVVKECIAALFPEDEKKLFFLNKLVEIAEVDSNCMSCSLGFLIGVFQEEEKDTVMEFSTNSGTRTISFHEVNPVEMDVQIFTQALYDSYKKIPERIEVFRRWLLKHIEELQRFPEIVTKRQVLFWKEGIHSLEQEIVPLIAASLEEFPKLLLGEFTFCGETYTMEKISEKLSWYYKDVESVWKRLEDSFSKNRDVIKISSAYSIPQETLPIYSSSIPDTIDTLEQMSGVLSGKITPHPVYFFSVEGRADMIEELKRLYRPDVFEDLSGSSYDLATNAFKIIRISSSESEEINLYPHVYEYRLSLEDLDAFIEFEREEKKVNRAFETFISRTIFDVIRQFQVLEKKRNIAQQGRDNVSDTRPLVSKQMKNNPQVVSRYTTQICRERLVRKNASDLDQLLRGFRPYAWLESSEEVRAKLFAEALLREEEQKVSAKKGKKSSREKKKSSSVSRKKSVKELSPLEALQKQMARLKNLLSSAAYAQENAFMKAALFQSQLSLFHLEQAACYTSIFSAKVWLPIFLEEGYLTVEQVIKGIFPQIEDRTSHGIKHLLEQSLQAPFVSDDALDNIDKGYVTSYRFLDVYKEAQKAQQWFGSYKINPLISKGMESLDEVEPTEMLIQEACQIAKILESFLPSRDTEEREEQKLSKRFSADLPCLLLMPERQLHIKPFVQRRKEVEAHLQKVFVFNKALLEILQHLNSKETFTEEQMALHCKEIAFLVTKSIEFALHAILSGQNNAQLRYSHDICELFEEAFGHQEQTLQEMREVLTNAHLCLRYPLQKRKVYSTVHKISLVAAKVFCPQAEAVESIFLQLQQDEIQEPFDFLQEQTTHVLFFAKTLFEEYLIGALEMMA